SALITSPPPRVPSDHQVFGLTLSLMNRTLPSARSVLTPPGWKLPALLKGAMVVDPVLLQWVHLREFGVSTVLNSVCVKQPCAQSRPFCTSKLPPVAQAVSQSAMAAWTAGRLLRISSCRAAVDMFTLLTPSRATLLPACATFTTPSE